MLTRGGSLLFASTSYADELSITFDDLPGQQENESAENQMAINEHILKALKSFGAPAIGFVNEGKLYKNGQTKEKIAILKLWVDGGYPLGNHTYSHKSLSNVKPQEFQIDVIKGKKISKKLMENNGMPYLYFRHPYLDTGATKKMRDSFESFLKKEDLTVAPVTIDTDDWKFDQELSKNPQNKEDIIKKYLEHTRAKFIFYKAASEKIFGRNIKHIWLLHVNRLNSYAMNDLLKIASEMGYKFITLDQALEDKAYLEADNYYEAFGTSWLYRWDFTRGKVVEWSLDPEVDVNNVINAKKLSYLDKSRNRSIPVQIYVSERWRAKAEAGIVKLPVIVINHGHGVKNTEYSFIAKALAVHGYYVMSVQHDLKADKPFLKTGNLFEDRKTLWERGVKNILFAINELKKTELHLDLDKVILIGHSNGGDISMRFADLHPEMVSKVISLDSRRYPFPKNANITILRLGVSDDEPDEGVVSDNAQVIYVDGARHIDLCDKGGHLINESIVKSILQFLK